MNWHGCHARSSADQYRYIGSTNKINTHSCILKSLKYSHKNICLVVHFRCAICPATLLANTKMRYLLKNIHHLKWIKKLWWYCGRGVCPHIRKISLWAQGMTVSPVSGISLFPQQGQPSCPFFHDELREKNRGSVPRIEVCVYNERFLKPFYWWWYYFIFFCAFVFVMAMKSPFF